MTGHVGQLIRRPKGADRAFAFAAAALKLPLHATVWTEQWDDFDLRAYVPPQVVVEAVSSEHLQRAPEAVEIAVRRRFGGREKRRLTWPRPKPQIDHTPRRHSHAAPPGKLVSISPNRPHGPPLPRVALPSDDVMAAAAA